MAASMALSLSAPTPPPPPLTAATAAVPLPLAMMELLLPSMIDCGVGTWESRGGREILSIAGSSGGEIRCTLQNFYQPQ